MAQHPPIVWSIAGLDTAGGAGLSADQRAADALGVHLCPVAACLTAQNSQGVQALFPVSAEALQAQLQALAQDLPPRAIKTGLLGSVEAIEAVARWVDHFRAQTPAGTDPHQHLALVVDPVLKASAGGQPLSHEALLRAYREHLLPRATVITPNRAEAGALLGHTDKQNIPALARALQAMGSRAVFITGGDAEPDATHGLTASHDIHHSIDWLQTPHAQGWLTAPRVNTPHHHGTGCTLASGMAAALALGHVEADACVLSKMLTHHALMHSHAAGQGAGPVVARTGFAAGPAHGGAPLPMLGLGKVLPWALNHRTQTPGAVGHDHADAPLFQAFEAPANGLYGIVPSASHMEQALNAGMRCMQLRHKDSEGLAEHLKASLLMAQRAGVQVFINDHWQAALDAIDAACGGPAPIGRLGLHLGQEDLLALNEPDQQRLLQARTQVMLGLSSHSLWELARAAGCGASYIACGPVQATTTKDMPWRPQGLHNLHWWVAHSPAPVVGIGGLLGGDDLARFAPIGAAALCVVRALTDAREPLNEVVAALSQAAMATAPEMAEPSHRPAPLPTPVLTSARG
jgi:hydroxymethylpyrimidine kinase/phosphomethylpyrimidine kinase/thiamine-phosphate diphosphorylase